MLSELPVPPLGPEAGPVPGMRDALRPSSQAFKPGEVRFAVRTAIRRITGTDRTGTFSRPRSPASTAAIEESSASFVRARIVATTTR